MEPATIASTAGSIEKARGWVRSARLICALTGAGISAESGVPTFRGDGGLWRTFRAEDLATPEAFARDPRLSWEWYDWRRSRIAEAKPNDGHLALARWQQHRHLTVITQNVDGLHDLAESQDLLKLHGDIWTLRCTKCGRKWVDRRSSLPQLPPVCECGAIARPGVVWFGEALPASVWDAAEAAVASCDVCLVIGTSAVVYPAAGLAHLARERGAKVIEINTAATPLTAQVDFAWQEAAAIALPQLLA